MSTYGIPNQLYKDAAKQAYSADPVVELGDGFALNPALSNDTLKFWVSGSSGVAKCLVGIRGTQVTDWRDLSADEFIAGGKLEESVRAKYDMERLEYAKKVMPNTDFYGAGHSLGGALLDLYISKGYLIGGRSYNGALQLGQEEATNTRLYNSQDALYNLSKPFLKQTPIVTHTDNLVNKLDGIPWWMPGKGILQLGAYAIDTAYNRSPQILGAHNIGTISGAGKPGRAPEHMSRGDYYQAGINRHFRYV